VTLDNGKKWAAAVNDNEEIECCCAKFPDLPTRHGHVYCPSWLYSGPHQDTIRACMRSHVGTGDDWYALAGRLRGAWLQSLPDWSCPSFAELFNELEGTGLVTSCAAAYRPRTVGKVRNMLSPLAVTIMDKQASALLLL
jgi:hypothetical protein